MLNSSIGCPLASGVLNIARYTLNYKLNWSTVYTGYSSLYMISKHDIYNPVFNLILNKLKLLKTIVMLIKSEVKGLLQWLLAQPFLNIVFFE